MLAGHNSFAAIGGADEGTHSRSATGRAGVAGDAAMVLLTTMRRLSVAAVGDAGGAAFRWTGSWLTVFTTPTRLRQRR